MMRWLLVFILAATCNAQDAPARWKVWALTGSYLASTAADLALTRTLIDSGQAYEANPMLGQTTHQQVIVSVGISGALLAAEYLLLKKHSPIWWLVPVAGTASHGIGIWSGLRIKGR